MAVTYEPIASQTLGANAASVEFLNLPSTFTDIVIVCQYAQGSGSVDGVFLRFNTDSATNYSQTALYGNGSTSASQRVSSTTRIYVDWSTGYYTTGQIHSAVASVMSYSNTNVNKTVLCASASTNTNGTVARSVGLWRSTSAITSLSLTAGGVSTPLLQSGSTFSLFGVKAQ